MVMAPNGTLINQTNAKQMADSGIKRISVSLDGATKESHDNFRGVAGAFDGAIRGIQIAKEAGIDFQINTTITKANLDQILSSSYIPHSKDDYFNKLSAS